MTTTTRKRHRPTHAALIEMGRQEIRERWAESDSRLRERWEEDVCTLRRERNFWIAVALASMAVAAWLLAR